MSVRSSSFDNLTDLESVKSVDTSTFEDFTVINKVPDARNLELDTVLNLMEKMKVNTKERTEEV